MEEYPHEIDFGFLQNLLGAKNIQKLRDELTNMIIENLQNSVNEYSLEPPDEICEYIDIQYKKIIDEVVAKYKGTIKKQIKAILDKKLEQFENEL